MNKSSWLLNRLQTGSFAVLIMCVFGYLAALWAAQPRTSPFLTTDNTTPPVILNRVGSAIRSSTPSPQSAAQTFMNQHPIASTSAFAYTVVVFVCMGLMLVASIAFGRILTERNRKGHGIIGWSVVMVGAWSLVLLTAGPFFVPCPPYEGPGITCSVASQAAAHWALGLLPLCAVLTVLPAIAAFSALRLMTKPSAPKSSMARSLV